MGGLVPSELTRQAGCELLRGWERGRRCGRRHRERSELEKEDQEGNGKVGGDLRQPLLSHSFAPG